MSTIEKRSLDEVDLEALDLVDAVEGLSPPAADRRFAVLADVGTETR